MNWVHFNSTNLEEISEEHWMSIFNPWNSCYAPIRQGAIVISDSFLSNRNRLNGLKRHLIVIGYIANLIVIDD